MNINMKDFVKNDIAYLPGAFLSLWLVCTFPVKMTAQTSDSIRTKEIDEVVVKAKMQHTNAMSSTYIPTMKQRDSQRKMR